MVRSRERKPQRKYWILIPDLRKAWRAEVVISRGAPYRANLNNLARFQLSVQCLGALPPPSTAELKLSTPALSTVDSRPNELHWRKWLAQKSALAEEKVSLKELAWRKRPCAIWVENLYLSLADVLEILSLADVLEMRLYRALFVLLLCLHVILALR